MPPTGGGGGAFNRFRAAGKNFAIMAGLTSAAKSRKHRQFLNDAAPQQFTSYFRFQHLESGDGRVRLLDQDTPVLQHMTSGSTTYDKCMDELMERVYGPLIPGQERERWVRKREREREEGWGRGEGENGSMHSTFAPFFFPLFFFFNASRDVSFWASVFFFPPPPLSSPPLASSSSEGSKDTIKKTRTPSFTYIKRSATSSSGCLHHVFVAVVCRWIR